MSDLFAVQTDTGWGRTLQAFAEWCRPQAGWLALDVGCGPGLLPALLARLSCRSLGLDHQLSGSKPLHLLFLQADARRLPFTAASFDLATATNLLFLVDKPLAVLQEMRRVIRDRGQVCLLNPSERMSLAAAAAYAAERGLHGFARESFLQWARRAEAHPRWSEADLQSLFAGAGLRLIESTLKIGPGLARFARGIPT